MAGPDAYGRRLGQDHDHSATGEGGDTLSPSSVDTDDLTDGAGISHTEQLADLGQVFLASYDSTVGGGSVSDNSGTVEIREPGAASSRDESRVYSHIFEFDPSVSRRIRANLSNVTIDDNSQARVLIGVGDSPDSGNTPGDDLLMGEVQGSGKLRAFTSDDTTSGSTADLSQDNTFVSNLNYIQLSWDGSMLTFEASDGNTTVTVSDSSNYPSGETLHLKIACRDNDGNNARNVDIDVDSVVFDQ